MVHISRRHLLALAPAGLALAALRPRLQARAEAVNDHDRLLANTVAMVAGTVEVNAHPAAAASLQRIHDTARTRLSQLEAAGPGEVFAGVPLGENEANLSTTLQRLYQIALATCTPGVESDLVGDAEVRQRVLTEVHRVYTDFLADTGAGYYGNWYAWEIGIPTHLTRTLVLLADQADPERVDDYVAVMDEYLRNGSDGDVDLDSRFHTGANLADITTNRILQGALTGDSGRISKAISDQATAYATIDPYDLQHGVTDGYYADGSFIQHHTVAYTGSYGRILLTRVLQTIKILDGADAGSDSTDLADVVFDWVADGFAPLIFEGWMMEAVKGRAVSRTNSGYADVGSVAEAVVDLIDHTSPERAQRLAGYVKHLATAAANPPDATSWVSPVSVVRHAQIMADDGVRAADLNPGASSVAYNAMERMVHRRPGFAFTVSRSSERISKYEYMNGENLMPWFSGDGAFHLYLSGQDQEEAYGARFLATVSPYRLPGVSAPDEERATIPDLYGQFWYENPSHPLEFTSSSESQNTYVYFPVGTTDHSGGVTLDGFGSAALVLSDDVAYRDKQAGLLPEDFVAYAGVRGVKSWFGFDDAVVVLAAGITDPVERGSVTTTLDARVADPQDQVEVTGANPGGRPWTGQDRANLAWLRWANQSTGAAVAYALLDGGPVEVRNEQVEQSLRSVRAGNPDTVVSRQVFTVSVDHGRPHLAYVIVPGGDAAAAKGYRDGGVHVMANNERVQTVRHPASGITAMNSFSAGTHSARLLSVQGPACVLMREQGGEVHIAVSDPTMGRAQIPLTLRGGRAPEVIEADEGVDVEPARGETRITARTGQAFGATFTVRLKVR